MYNVKYWSHKVFHSLGFPLPTKEEHAWPTLSKFCVEWPHLIWMAKHSRIEGARINHTRDCGRRLNWSDTLRLPLPLVKYDNTTTNLLEIHPCGYHFLRGCWRQEIIGLARTKHRQLSTWWFFLKYMMNIFLNTPWVFKKIHGEHFKTIPQTKF